MRTSLSIVFASLLSLASCAVAQEAEKEKKEDGEKDITLAHLAEADAGRVSVTKHSVEIGGRTIEYTATAGLITLFEEDGTEKARVFYIAYTKDGVGDVSERPLTFSFNGGPGSSSVWLHLGAFGPRRVEMGDAGALTAPPYGLVDNEHSILDLTDLVFIDPVTTGYSRAVPGESDKQFHGLDEDIQSVAEVIRLYVTRNGRWGSPKFLAGESYGTTRAAGLSSHLQARHGMFLNGLVLVSSVLDFSTIRFRTGHDLPHVLFLPSFAATAHYHGALDAEYQGRGLEEFLDEVEAFAIEEYAPVLLKGASASEAERRGVAERVARYTGVPVENVLQNNLRLEIFRFTKDLKRDDRRTVGRLDSRFLGIDRDAGGERWEYDPSMSAIMGPYTGALNAYVRGELGFESELPYEILTGRVHPWSYDRFNNAFVQTAEPLRSAMTQNEFLRVFVANGYYDLATPYFATEHTFNNLMLDESLRGNVEMDYYPAGHMMYVHLPSLAKLKRDIADFYRATLER